MASESLLSALSLMVLCLICSSTGTGFLYQFPGVTVQRANTQQSASTGPPGTGSNTLLSVSRNWCQYTVSKTVTCQVHNGTETTVQRVFQGCRWPGPCSKLISYRAVVRPSYKVAYRQVTALEWKCCPGFVGHDCRQECMNCTGYTDMTSRVDLLEAKMKQLEEAGSPLEPVNSPPEGSTDNEVDSPRPTPLGPPSPPGGRGPPGPIGPPGIPGSAGPKGAAGVAGVPGGTGPIGPKGGRGYPGEIGLPGPPGQPGPPSTRLRGDVFGLGEQEETLPEPETTKTRPAPPGPPGPLGPPGPPGPIGPAGFPGVPGRDAEGGPPGKPGDVGPRGEAGVMGPPGLTGEQGQPGPVGLKGEPGETLAESEGVQQLREALKILAERVLILEHMIGIHENPGESGSGLSGLPDLLPFSAFKTRRGDPLNTPALPLNRPLNPPTHPLNPPLYPPAHPLSPLAHPLPAGMRQRRG